MTNKNDIEEQDQFISQIRNKLESHTTPVDDKVWKKIEKQLGKKKRIAPLWYAVAGGIAASLALLLLLNPFSENRENISQMLDKNNITVINDDLNTNIRTKNKKNQSADIKKEEKHCSKTIAESIETFKQEKENQSSQTKQESTTKDIKPKQNLNSQNSISDINAQKDNPSNEVTPGNANSDLQKENPAKTNKPEITSLQENPKATDIDIIYNKKQDGELKDFTLAANIGTNGGAELGSMNGRDIAYGDIMASSKKMEINGITYFSQVGQSTNNGFIETSEFTKVKHLPPLTFSLLIQKRVFDKLSASTGISYTYLRSNYSLKNSSREAHLSTMQHYVGIPLNINTTLMDNSKLACYFSVGGTVEKGIAFIRKQTITANNNETTLSDKSNIDGFQTSINSAIGINYKIDKNWNIFLEPKAIYYFDNGQPTSARTETPLNLGLNGGVKYNL